MSATIPSETDVRREKKHQHIQQARLLARKLHTGVLSTHSKALEGYPFGSVTPYMMTDDGNILIYASDIAQHSRNMKEHNKVSLCIFDAEQDDSQASARVTFMAEASWDKVSDNEQERYFELFPKARGYVEAHDFRFYLLKVSKIRYIGGFGEIFWFDKDEWNHRLANLAHAQKGIIEHMHEDHLDALELIYKKHKGEKPLQTIKMLSVFPEGFHVESKINGKTECTFVPFKKPLTAEYTARAAMVELTKEARSR